MDLTAPPGGWLEYDPNLLVVVAELAFEIGELASQVFVRGQNFAELRERPPDRDVEFDSAVAPNQAKAGHPQWLGAI